MTKLSIEREEMLRRRILELLDEARPRPLGDGMLAELLEHDRDLAVNHQAIMLAIDYLVESGLVDRVDSPGRSPHFVKITPDGVDQVDAWLPQLIRQRRRMLRLRVLQALDWGLREPMGEGLIYRAIKTDSDLDLSPGNIRRALDYVVDAGLARFVTQPTDEIWMAKLMPAGVDYIQGRGPALPGIPRPFQV